MCNLGYVELVGLFGRYNGIWHLMMDKYDIMYESKSDKVLLELIGNYVKWHRQNQNMTQAELATAAGINRSTLSELENGSRSNTMTLIRVLRSLGRLSALDSFEQIHTVSPLALAEEQAVYRRRVRHKSDATEPFPPKSDW